MIRKRVAPCDGKLALNCGCRHVSRSVNIRFQLIEYFQANFLSNKSSVLFLFLFLIFIIFIQGNGRKCSVVKWKKTAI